MSSKKVADLTMEELEKMIDVAIDERLEQVKTIKIKRSRTPQEVNESIRRNRWTPPPGAPTSLELIRADRDR